jgi:hypothetical protein
MATEFQRLKVLATLVKKYFPSRSQFVSFRSPRDLHSRVASELANPEVLAPADIETLGNGQSRSYVSATLAQVKAKLLGMLFNLDLTQGESSAYRQAYYENARQMFITDALNTFGQRDEALRVARSGFAAAVKSDLTLNQLAYLRVLRQDALIKGNHKEWAVYSEKTRLALSRLQFEADLTLLGEELTLGLAVTGAPTPDLTRAAKSTIEEIEGLLDQAKTLSARIAYYRTLGTALEIAGDFDSALRLSDGALKYLATFGDSVSPSYVGEFALKKLVSALHVSDQPAARTALSLCEVNYGRHSINWFRVQEYSFVLNMRQDRYKDALRIVETVKGDPRFNLLPHHVQQRWSLFELYARFASDSDSIRAEADKTLRQLSRLRRSVAAYGKDKTGFNFAILVLEVMVEMTAHKWSVVEKRYDALRMYRTRYLREPTVNRETIDLLMSVIRHYGDKQKLRSIVKAAERKFNSTLNHESELPILTFQQVALLLFESLL